MRLTELSSSPYKYEFDPSDNSTAAKVVHHVGEKKYILEIGCAYGIMTKVFHEYNGCKVFGVEYDAASAQYARPYCDELAVIDIEKTDWKEVLGDRRFDVIVIADVLEHLSDPHKCLDKLKDYLTPDGYFTISIPNVAHNGIVAELLSEDFTYRRTGLLDATHIHFVGYDSLKKLFEDAGLKITDLEYTRIAPELSEFGAKWIALPRWLTELLEMRPFGDVYQFVFKAYPSSIKDLAQRQILDDATWSPPPMVTAARLEAAEKKIRQLEVLEKQLDQILASQSWRLTRPLRFSVRILRHGLVGEDRQQVVNGLRGIYQRLPIPAAGRRKISYGLRRLRSLMRPAPPRWKAPDSSVKLADAVAGRPDYIVFSIIDWHFRHQRPQHLAQQFSASGRRTFYISVTPFDSDEPGFVLESLDSEGLFFNVCFHLRHAPTIYNAPPTAQQLKQLRGGLALLLGWAKSSSSVAVVQHPYWCDLGESLPASKLVYDLMDHHEGFGDFSQDMAAREQHLISSANLTVTTSGKLEEAVKDIARKQVTVRNAGEYEHFATPPADLYKDPSGRRIIGYYGAIAPWFDLDLLAAVADAFPDCCILMIGADTVDARRSLSRHKNIVFLGEIPYRELPRYSHAFDVCLLPFKVLPLTLATNPVKVYEYLSMGKPVVGVDLPEMQQFGALCRVASNYNDFVSAVGEALKGSTAAEVKARQAFGREQTWAHRAELLISEAENSDADPVVSVVVVTYNNLDLTKECLASLETLSDYPKLEIIVVDNASSDGSVEWLSEWAHSDAKRILILNEDNKGFAAANNQGLLAASGRYMVMLNNDTYVTPGWIRTMVNHMMRDPTIGLLGPVTNNIGNEARIDISYGSMDEMISSSAKYTLPRMGQIFPLRTVAFFCVMLERGTFEKIGPLDEAFGRGFFEDDDYCRRIETAGLKVICAEDVFIHHHLSASFNKLKQHERQRLFEENKRVYEAKWGPWIPHDYRR